MKFHYPKLMFAIRAMALLVLLTFSIILMENADTQMNWLLGFTLIFIIAITITTITPIFTRHEIDANGILLRQGMIFKASFSFTHIEAVEIYGIKPSILGLVSTRSKIILASGNKGLVRIKLNHKRRFGMLLLRQANEIIIDLEEPEKFVKLINEHLKDNSK